MASKLTDAEKALIEELWSLGLPERAIGREVGRPHSTVRGYVKVLRRPAPPVGERSPHLWTAKREDISRGLAAGESLRAIAARIGRAPSASFWSFGRLARCHAGLVRRHGPAVVPAALARSQGLGAALYRQIFDPRAGGRRTTERTPRAYRRAGALGRSGQRRPELPCARSAGSVRPRRRCAPPFCTPQRRRSETPFVTAALGPATRQCGPYGTSQADRRRLP